MDQTTLETLEYPAVLNELAARTSTPEGRERAEGLAPHADIGRIEESRTEFAETSGIIKAFGRLPLGGVSDLRAPLARIDRAGSYLLPEELIKIRDNLGVSARLKSALTPQFTRDFRLVSSRIEALSDQSPLASELNRIIDEKGEIADSATPALSRIRREIRSNRARARSILDELTADEKYAESIQEDYVTIRDDRYVISVKSGMHGRMDGIIHGRSGSGATYFVEPFRLVELNNSIAILKKEEKAEEIEILKDATRKVLGSRVELLADQGIIAGLDCAQAKVIFANDIGAAMPVVRGRGDVDLRGARHPLLVLKEARCGERVTPIDITIREGCGTLVISGANTGGKTVALKTLGLLTLMALSGIPVPVEGSSTAVAFSAVFADIGDRQDIIASLSTFSAHIKRIKEFLTLAGAGSLVLLDEIGAGTDPSEGSAFALAALDAFKKKGATTVVTTHSNILKAHAQTDPDYMNAAVEFDESTLRPLYRLNYGVPGPSLGLSIAQSLGIPPAIIEAARGNLKESEGAFIESVRMLEEERDEIRRLRGRLSTLERERDDAVRKLREKRDAIIEKGRERIDSAVAKAKKDMKEVLERVGREAPSRAGGARAVAAIEQIGRAAIGGRTGTVPVYVPCEGDRVAISGSNAKGAVVKVDADSRRAEVQVKGLKVWASWDKLIKRGTADKPHVHAQGFSINADMEVVSSVNVIGSTVDEAEGVITGFLDRAHALGVGTVEIIHGIGTGRLARGIEGLLRRTAFVKRFYRAEPAKGGAGVTVVELE